MALHRVLVLVAALAATAASSQSPHCRCRPQDPCWPAPSEWQALNSSVDGNLVALKPVGSVCHDPTYNAAVCKAVTTNSSNSLWRAQTPAAVQWVNWEALPSANQSCYLNTARREPCGQGRVSLYSVVAESEEHIRTAVRFATKHNLRLTVKNTGHDFSGRSSAPESLQISTYKLDGTAFTDDFVTHGNSSTHHGPAVTIDAGVQVKPLYQAAATRNLAVVAGFSHTVGAAGGYLQGGGHSPLGNWKGMASDNALEYRVVTAKGDVVTANEHQNQDLFWALRGGGGGTFGIVTKATLRTFPDAPLVVGSVNATIPAANGAQYWDAVRELHSHLPRLNGGGGGGYYDFTPLSPQPNGSFVSTLTLSLFFINQTDQGAVDSLFRPLVAALQNITTPIPGATAFYASLPVPLTRDLFAESLPGDGDISGITGVVGSRLISRDFLSSPEGPRRVAEAISRLRHEPAGKVTGHVVAGGAVARPDAPDTALNPAWRKTLSHLLFSRGWADNATVAEQRAITTNITEVEVPLLRALHLENETMGAYINEADSHEAGYQASFWGHNYPRLYAIKQRWDPTGLFVSRLSVGSEDWDAEGFCRLK